VPPRGQRYRIAFANINDAQGVHVGASDSLADVRQSFELAVHPLPVDMLYCDNAADAETAVSNAPLMRSTEG
jgi:hypothetical protein